MKIGELANQTGLAASAIRFYERSGLLPAAERGLNGYRSYGEGDVQRLHMIRIAQSLGFSLEIMRHVFGSADGIDDAQVQSTLELRLREIEQLMSTLRKQRKDLLDLRETLRGGWAAGECIDAAALSESMATKPLRASKPRKPAASDPGRKRA